MNSHGDDDEEDDDSAQHVGDGMERRNQGRAHEAAVNRPVEGGGHQAISVARPKDLLNDDAVRDSPADPGKGREAPEDPPGEPIPEERAESDDEEELVAANGPAVRL